MNDSDRLDSRVAELEFQFAHLQRVYDQLNEVVIQQARLLDRAQRRIQSLESQVSELKHARKEPSDPLDEKPPHY